MTVWKMDKTGSWATGRFWSEEQLKFGASVNGVLFFGQKYDSSNQSPGCGPVALIYVIPIGKKEARIRKSKFKRPSCNQFFLQKERESTRLGTGTLFAHYFFIITYFLHHHWVTGVLNLPDTGVAMNIDPFKIVTPPVIQTREKQLPHSLLTRK